MLWAKPGAGHKTVNAFGATRLDLLQRIGTSFSSGEIRNAAPMPVVAPVITIVRFILALLGVGGTGEG
jgi:hypothetical protein